MPHRPFFEGINHVVKALRECSYEHMTLYELDGATGNERLYHHFLSLGYPGTMIELIKCRNHQTNLVEGGVVLTSSPRGHNLLSLFYSFTHFVRTGGHWFRMKQSLRAWIQETALVHRVRTKLLSNEERAWQEHAQET